MTSEESIVNNTLAVAVDVEDWYHFLLVTGSSFSEYGSVDDFFKRFKGRYDYLSSPTRRILDFFDELDLHATFFVVADVLDHYPGLIERVREHGHEIACHGFHHMCIIDPETRKPVISQQEFEMRMGEAKRKLEKISGEEVIGFRAPNAYISGWMLDSLEKIGYDYDSSVCVNSLYNKADVKPNLVTTKPYFPQRGSLEVGKEQRILEIPWPYWNVGGIKFPVAGGPLLRFLGSRYIMAGLEQSLRRGDTVFYFHPLDISSEIFPVRFSLKRPFFWSVKGRCVERGIRHILTHIKARRGTCRDIWKKTLKNRGEDLK